MTGGACAGFAAATAVCTGSVTARACCKLIGVDFLFLNISIPSALPLSYIWIPVVIGLICGICAVLFTRLYYIIKKFLDITLKKFRLH